MVCTYRSVDTFASVLEPSASCEEVVCHWRDDVPFCSRSDVQQAEGRVSDRTTGKSYES